MNTERNKKRFKRNMQMSCYGVLLVFCIFFHGCGIYDDMKDCAQGINVYFYSKTACSSDTVYPSVQDVKVLVFDANDLLVSASEDKHVTMQAAYHQTVKAANGLFSVVAWAGLGSVPFDMNAAETAITTKTELLFRLQRAAQQAASLEGKRVYYGESSTIFLPDPAEYGSVFETAKINLKEITNRFTITVEGLPPTGDYELIVESANGAMNIDGSMAADEVIQYPAVASVNEGVLEAKFTVLKLETGRSSTLIVKDKQHGQELFRGDLLGTLLLKNPEVNLACDHDFSIRFTAADQCACGTYMVVEIWVNNWLVHSYTADL
jgi:hypothetical protein